MVRKITKNHWSKTDKREETLKKIKEARAKQIFSKESQIKKVNSLRKWHKENKDTKKYKERGKKISLRKLGHKVKENTKNKLNKKSLGKHYSLKTEFKKGMVPWNKGIKYSPKRIEKCREVTKKLMTEDFKKKLSKIRKERIALGLIKFPKGKESPSWLGGKSFEPYDYKFNKEFKNLVRLRDNFCCMNCGISEQKSIILINRALSVHHIDYNKKNTCLINCITLCGSCNNKANFNRKEWENYFNKLLSKKYNYQNKLIEGVFIVG